MAHLTVQLTLQAGDTLGRINCIDPRQPKPFAQPQLHRKDKVGCAAWCLLSSCIYLVLPSNMIGTSPGPRVAQIVSVHVNPADSHLLLTASNDHTARITDMRCVSSQAAASSSGAHSAAVLVLPFSCPGLCTFVKLGAAGQPDTWGSGNQ